MARPRSVQKRRRSPSSSTKRPTLSSLQSPGSPPSPLSYSSSGWWLGGALAWCGDALHAALASLPWAAVPDGSPGAHFVPIWPMLVFLGSACCCLTFSSIFHTFHIVNRRVFDMLARLDYAGIALLVAGSTIPVVWYGLWCSPGWRNGYALGSVVVCSSTLFLCLDSRFTSVKHRPLRTFMFFLCGLYGVLPLAHLSASNTPAQRLEGGGGLAVMGGLYITGALLYALRVPERWSSTGAFDLVGSSHQLFHLCVVGAAWTHYRVLLGHLEWRIENPVCD